MLIAIKLFILFIIIGPAVQLKIQKDLTFDNYLGMFLLWFATLNGVAAVLVLAYFFLFVW